VTDENAVELRSVTRRFGAVAALDGISFAVKRGEFFGMLGPSGSGKTTCLRMIAGFDLPTSGEVLIAGRSVGDLPPYERDAHTVFQDYALFPHMSVADNVAFPLMIAKVAKLERLKRAEAMLDRVKLGGFGNRRPSELSGGQRQRVALARALIDGPSVLLLDEPLGALDLKLREDMQRELKELQRSLGITFIFVTHDQGEALGMSDRIAVFNQGRIEQLGSPDEIYDRPQSAFVATFVGSANVVDAALLGPSVEAGKRYALRPERVRLLAPDSAAAAGGIQLPGTLRDAQHLGADTRFTLAVDGDRALHATLRHGDAEEIAARTRVGQAIIAVFEPADLKPLAS
jgi:putative spermidine/putrescine transport system ATP-binding protein